MATYTVAVRRRGRTDNRPVSGLSVQFSFHPSDRGFPPMKIKAALIAVSAAALLAACSQPADTAGAPTTDAASTAPVALKATSGVYVMDPTHASLQWSLPHLGISNYTARFNKFDAKITLDTANLANSTVEATIDPASVDTNYP